MTQTIPVPAALSTRVLLQPLRAGLVEGQDTTVDVLVRVQAPDAPAGQFPDRAPHALALVIDKSGSMAGQPLAEAIRCARMVVDRLRPVDSVSLVEFDDCVRRLWPAVPRGDGTALHRALDGVHDGGSTDLHGGWREGAETLADVAGSGLKRVVLLSDGAANQGLQDPRAIATQCSEFAARGITTSTYGLGNHFNEELMVAMARAGAGNSYYGDTAEDLAEPFQRELDLLGNLCLSDLQISLQAPAGVQTEMLNDLPRTAAGWRLADLAWGAEAWAVVRVRVPASQASTIGSSVSVLKVRVAGLESDGTAIDLERVGLTLPVLTFADWARLPEDPLVAQRLAEIEASAVLQQMRHAAGQGDWSSVDRMLEDAQRRFGGHEWLAAVLESMKQTAASRSRERLRKEALYSASSMNYRLSDKDEQIHFSAVDESTSKPSYLRRKPTQGKGRQ
ncbi:VWA domain-containing protein [uncultured Piscinibacter sp.]|uniref:vWA domain-containing protein n=1 Tax=uncultured Piscinibacter sp. TaxID=1131835 RepID=UPI0026325189|nr:VWA domain-containing protein [uncultured Piscinibacter sp.]